MEKMYTQDSVAQRWEPESLMKLKIVTPYISFGPLTITSFCERQHTFILLALVKP